MDGQTDTSVPEWDDASWALLDDAVGRLEAAWEESSIPTLSEFIPVSRVDPRYGEMLVRLIAVDQQCRLRQGKNKDREAYLAEHPHLRDHCDLIRLLESLEPHKSVKGMAPTSRFREPTRERPKGEYYERGDVIGGKYEVVKILGKGGFGIVYLVISHHETRGVCPGTVSVARERFAVRAIKTFRDEFLTDQRAREEFRKEALVWVRLNRHPFILEAEFVEEFSGRLFVAMECVFPDLRGRVSLADHLSFGNSLLDEAASPREGRAVW